MAIQLRRGAYADFDPTKMVPAEVGIVTSGDPNTDDGKAAYVAFSAGNAKRLATVEDIATDLQEATDEAVGQATARAEAAAESVEASAAQITTNKNDITALKADLSYYTEEAIPVNASPEGWRLTGNGTCTEATAYKLVKYEVTAGDMLHLVLSKDVTGSETEGVYQWQNAASVPSQLPNSGLIGTPVTEAVDGYVEVPTGATYLIVSQFKTNTTNKVMLVTDVETVKEKIAGIETDVDELDTKVDAIEPGLSADAKTALLACFEHVAWTDEHGQDYYDALYEALYNEKPPAPGPTVIKELSASDLLFGFGNSGGLYYSSPYNGYYIYQNAKRACYPLFDIAVEPGKSYKVEWDTTKISGAVGSISALSDDIDQRISTQSSIDDFLCEYPWFESGSVFKIPDTLYDSPMTKIRLVWKANEADTASFNQGDIQWVKITEDSVTEEADKARMFTVDDLSYRTGVLNSTPYYSDAQTNRIVLWNPVDIRAGSTYAITFKKDSSYSSAQVTPEILNENAVSAMANNAAIASADITGPGWINTGTTFSVPELINGSPAKKVRFSFRPQSGTSGTFSKTNAIVAISIARR